MENYTVPSQRKFKIFFAFFSYGGNGGTAMLLPEIRKWWGHQVLTLARDPRIEAIVDQDISDTPITMTRNKSVATARQWGADILVMIDSDNIPDLYLDVDKEAKAFIPSSLDFLIDNYDKGPHVVFCPYCGPPPHPTLGGDENVYVFHWKGRETNSVNPNFSLGQYTREHAFSMRGIQQAGAGPTGAIMYDMRAFDLIAAPYFDYEYTNADRSAKSSTEDVVNTRNISFAGCTKLGYNPVFCNWDAWAGHTKPKVVGKPNLLCANEIADHFKNAVLANVDSRDRLIEFESPYMKELLSGKHEENVAQADQALIPGRRVTQAQAEEMLAAPHRGVEMMPWDKDAIRELLTMAAANTTFVRVIEVGTWIGNTAKFMHEVLQELGVSHRIDCVDTFHGSPTDLTSDLAGMMGGSTHGEFVRNVGDLRGSVIFEHIGESTDVALNWQDKADLIFIDADHSYEATTADIEAWRPHLKSNGILAGHDYDVNGFEGVKKAVLEIEAPAGCTGGVNATVWHVKGLGKKRTTAWSVRELEPSVIDCVPNLQPV